MKLKELVRENEEMEIGDWIISKFEAGELTYFEAKQKLMKTGNAVYIHELNMAEELMLGAGRTLH